MLKFSMHAPSQFPADTFRSLKTSEVDKYASTLSVAPLRIIVCSTINALNTTCDREVNRNTLDCVSRRYTRLHLVLESAERVLCKHRG